MGRHRAAAGQGMARANKDMGRNLTDGDKVQAAGREQFGQWPAVGIGQKKNARFAFPFADIFNDFQRAPFTQGKAGICPYRDGAAFLQKRQRQKSSAGPIQRKQALPMGWRQSGL